MEHSASPTLEAGRSHPLGATLEDGGVNFCVYARHATSLELLLFDAPTAALPAHVFELDPKRNRTDDYWHAFVRGAGNGQTYAFRAHGPYEPAAGHRFRGEKVVLDPYARSIVAGPNVDRDAARGRGDNVATAMRGVVVDPSNYDWEGDEPLRRSFSQTVIYEMHVRGFTQHESSGVARERRGTYAGLVDKIPYLVDLGVTAVELLPVQQFDVQDAPDGKTNYWGYSPIGFFAPHAAYASVADPIGVVDEFRDMVKALHRAGIEVILDVVFNHTAEGGDDGPTYSFRGLANRAYYILDDDKANYADFTGCGNTLNANHSVVRRMILDSLRYWVTEMHVDGFRFDLASILARSPDGTPVEDPPVIWAIDTMPELAGTKLIAEAWDAAGLYQVGSFVGSRWKEWNGRFRDDVRRFVRGDDGCVGSIGQRFLASPDIYGQRQRGPEQSINFVTCHDGFTLEDLVSYERKRNDANGEEGRDGSEQNFSSNHGVEGPSDDPVVESVRIRQIKNLLALNLLALGTPMLLMGDEMRRTQLGNNNAYCQDNEVSWLDWRLLAEHADVHRFVRTLIRLRRDLDVTRLDHGMDLETLLETAQISWHGTRLEQPDWSDTSHALAFTATNLTASRQFHVMLSALDEALEFELPDPHAQGRNGWRRVVDTSLASPDDACGLSRAPHVDGRSYRLAARSVVALTTELTN